MVGPDVEKVAFDVVGVGDGGNRLAVARHLDAVFVAGCSGLEVHNPRLGGGIDDAVGPSHLALPYEAGLVHTTVGWVEELGHRCLSHHVVQRVA